jgi:hypothetical protein
VITKRQVLQAIVGLIQVGDYELLKQQAVLAELGSPSDFGRILQIARAVKSLYDDFDFTKSSEFLRSIEGKSNNFAEVKRRLVSDPIKKAEQRARFAGAMIELPDADHLLGMIPEQQRSKVEELARAVADLPNPD